MFKLSKHICLLFVIICVNTRAVHSIRCYQCSGTDSDNPFECNEYLDDDNDLEPTDCSTIHDAQYCIKHVGRFEGVAIDCYQCNSSSTMECGDGLMQLDGGILKPSSCAKVYNAQYCIKQTGGVGTKRFCSALDLGTYCNYVQQPGDKLEYRTCIYTCSSDGGISTKRYCSSLDLGTYCNYVQQPGDKLEYRTCIYTCNTDGCNAAYKLRISVGILCLSSLILKLMTDN